MKYTDKFSERVLKFKNYRNIGVESEQKIVLNHTLDPKKMGDVVILIGPNNSGKSNVLSGLKAFANKQINSEDINDGFYELSDDNLPELEMNYSFKNNKYKVNFKYEKNEYSLNKISDNAEERIKESSYDIFKEEVIRIAKEYKIAWEEKSGYKFGENSYYGYNRDYFTTTERIISNFDEDIIEDESYFVHLSDMLKHIENGYNDLLYKKGKINSLLKRVKDINSNSELVIIRNEILKIKHSNPIIKDFKENLGFDIIPKVIDYNESKEIKNSELVCKNLELTTPIQNIIKYLGFSKEVIEGYYARSKTSHNPGMLEDLQKDVNKKMGKINTQFNKIYNSHADKYQFNLRFTPETIYFAMQNNDKNISLDKQSEGFKWFFNFFFNFLIKENVSAGDIIIIDEAGSKIHPKGVEELRIFLKDYAVENGLTFVIATHSPFMINTDNLEEVRVVYSNAKNECEIINKFTIQNEEDIVGNIKNALTVEKHIIMNPENTVFFVEGITDYNYLTAFKQLKPEYKHLQFIPIQGIKKSDKEFNELIHKLREIRKNPMFIVDGDNTAKKFQKTAEKAEYDVISLVDIDPSWKNIEDLFSQEDVVKNNLEDKKYNNAYVFKKTFEKKLLSKDTLNNFEKLFKELISY
ncbi:AAA family ATPase [[Acholeplasma] multilocale]|uniref:AAA family ATPase n=1 Tax=[Acholeplasma] multilocale TaxID=264638 RepID=UPI00047D50B1|nr:AAA family ATPase [[Acholeplasma] multilocale]